MPEFAKKITIDQGAKRLYMDGIEFPWHVSADGIEVTGLASRTEIPMVHLAIIAETVEVIPEIFWPLFKNPRAKAERIPEDI